MSEEQNNVPDETTTDSTPPRPLDREHSTSSQQFKNLVDIGQIKQEPGDQKEFDDLLHSGRTRLKDSRMKALSLESRFDLAYNAAHALSLAALRWHGYRSENRYIVFQCL
ncbi:MAG: hypothetical protein RQ722_13130, partial [Desulfuromonadales bacterium]|nr:hypothetical protein [Desulfuromonadales bacterium]